MASRFSAFAIAIALLLVFATIAAGLTVDKAYAAGTWYVGDGVKKDMWVQYQIQQLDTVNDQPFIMTMWFKDQDSKGNWNVPATVQYQGQTMNGTLRLAQNMAPLGGGQVPSNMQPFVGGYQNSLQWLDAFATKTAPQSLTALFWGRIASIGGSPVAPAGTEKISFAGAKDLCGAPQCDTTVVLWHKGVDNKVWIYDNFPFPVKADTFAEVASGQAPPLFKFELLATGTGQPPALAASAIPKPPVTASTASGNYVVTLDWQPTNITAGGNVTFGVTFSDKQGFPLQNVNYNFNVTDASGKSIANLKDQRSTMGGPETHSVKVDTAGPISVAVTVNSVNGLTQQSGIIDQATFTTVAVPEFPAVAVLVITAIIGLVVIMTRVKRIGLGSLFGGENTSTI